MRNLLKILVIGLLLVLAVALGAEVVAWEKASPPLVAQAPRPVLVRKVAQAFRSTKSVRLVPKPAGAAHPAGALRPLNNG
ncbi:MAG: hypothetical protein JWR44_3101, partial [Hymenobacter sp.]|nr:hypothetical protein [Hymenobacter sp.]